MEEEDGGGERHLGKVKRKKRGKNGRMETRGRKEREIRIRKREIEERERERERERDRKTGRQADRHTDRDV